MAKFSTIYVAKSAQEWTLGLGRTPDEAIADAARCYSNARVERVVEQPTIELEDGDVITATLHLTECDDDGIDHVVGSRPVTGVVKVKTVGEGLKNVCINSPFDPRAHKGQPYVALSDLVIGGGSNVLTDIQIVT